MRRLCRGNKRSCIEGAQHDMRKTSFPLQQATNDDNATDCVCAAAAGGAWAEGQESRRFWLATALKKIKTFPLWRNRDYSDTASKWFQLFSPKPSTPVSLFDKFLYQNLV